MIVWCCLYHVVADGYGGVGVNFVSTVADVRSQLSNYKRFEEKKNVYPSYRLT